MNPMPYASNLEYLEDEILSYFPARFSRMNLEQELFEGNLLYKNTRNIVRAAPAGELVSHWKYQNLKRQEMEIRKQIDNRLEFTRMFSGSSFLGIDGLVGPGSIQTRMMLLILLGTALGYESQVFPSFLYPGGGSLSLAELIQCLELNTIQERLVFRKLVKDLINQEVIETGTFHLHSPQDFNNLPICLTARAYNIILGLENGDGLVSATLKD